MSPRKVRQIFFFYLFLFCRFQNDDCLEAVDEFIFDDHVYKPNTVHLLSDLGYIHSLQYCAFNFTDKKLTNIVLPLSHRISIVWSSVVASSSACGRVNRI